MTERHPPKTTQEDVDNMIESAAHIIAAAVVAGARPGTICALACMMLEYALIGGNFGGPEKSHRLLDELMSKVHKAITESNMVVPPELVEQKMGEMLEEQGASIN